MKVGMCDAGCVGLGLVLPDKTASCWASHMAAYCIASLNFEGFFRIGEQSDYDPSLFPFPQLEFTEVEERLAEQTTVVEMSLMRPDERQQLRQLVNDGRLEEMDTLERKLLPLAYVPDLTEKVKLFCLNNEYRHLAAEVVSDFQRVTQACEDFRRSRHLLDVLSVILQISSYLSFFGEVDSAGHGFSLMKLNSITDFKLGKHSFLMMVCLFLANLRAPGAQNDRQNRSLERSPPQGTRPGPRRSLGTSDRPSAVRTTETTPTRTRSRGRRHSLGEDSAQKLQNDVDKEPSFIDNLEQELSSLREVSSKKDRLQRSALFSHRARFVGMANLVDRLLHGTGPEGVPMQRLLFDPDTDETDVKPQARFAELAAWMEGRRQLTSLLRHIQMSVADLEKREADLCQLEGWVKEFAALKGKEFESENYMSIFDVVVAFLDRLKQPWSHLSRTQHLEVLRTFRAAETLGMLSTNSVGELFEFWMEASHMHVERWDTASRSKAFDQLFQLFDLDGDETIDAEELRVTFGALGIVFPRDGPMALHFNLVNLYDTDHTGMLNKEGFQKFVESRLEANFELFLAGSPGSKAISAEDLLRVAEQVNGVSDIHVLERMARMLDDGSADDGTVTLDKFEQIILMPRDVRGSDVQTWGTASPADLKLRSDSFWLAADTGS